MGSLNSIMKVLTILFTLGLIATISALPWKDASKARVFSRAYGDRIVGGQEAVEGQFPWQISVREFFDSNLGHVCGGSILNSKWIMTAATCCGALTSSYIVVAGDVNHQVDEASEQHVNIVRQIKHENYGDATQSRYSNDICLLELETELILDDNVGPVSLPEPLAEIDAGTILTVSGYGVQREGGTNFPDTLRWVDVPAVSDDDCIAAYGSDVIESMTCAGDMLNGGIDACRGDSGGPYVIKDTDVQVALVSWGRGCAEPAYPGVNTQVSYFIDWINTNMS